MKFPSATALVALAVIAASGFIVGRVTSGGSSENIPDPSSSVGPGRSKSELSSDASAIPTSRVSRPERVEKASSEATMSRLEEIVRGENTLDRSRALLAFIDKLAPSEFEDAVDYFRKLGITEGRMGEYSLLLTAWADVDPTAALAYAKENTQGGFAQDTILTTWATKDPEAAIRWATANHQGDEPNPYFAGIVRGLADADPTRATELLASMPRSEERGKALDFILPHLLEQGAEATREWIAALGDDALKNGAMMRSADKLAASDPAATVSWLVENPGEAAQRRMDDVFSVWANTDSSAALSSLDSLPAGDLRSSALRGVVSSVAIENPAAAVALTNQYATDVNDRVIQNLIWHSFGTEPEIAVSQISRITDEGQRNRMYDRTMDAWMERDPASAQAWMASNPLPQSVQERQQRRIDGN